MISELHDRHRGRSVAIVGSSPSATLFTPQICDISIGLNGSALLGYRFDYFMCSDPDSHKRDWFYVDCSVSRVIAASIASMDFFLYPEALSHTLRQRVAAGWSDQYAIRLPVPRKPHFFYYRRLPTKSGLDNFKAKRTDVLMVRGTVAGEAVQLAYLMGASSITLFGCSFSRESSGTDRHYFYESDQDQIGEIKRFQLESMNLYLSVVRSQGVRVVIVGPTELIEYDDCIVGSTSECSVQADEHLPAER